MASPQPIPIDESGLQLERRRRLQAFSAFIAGAGSLGELVAGAEGRILELFDAERTTLYQLDTRNRHLYSLVKTGGEFKEIRVGLDLSSILGFAGVSKRSVNIPNVYDAPELRRLHHQLHFDERWDVASGFTTRSMLC